jgi:pimeloyl-ACP methyl ester carboxylesterase
MANAMWTPVPIPAQAPVTEGTVDVRGTRLWYWDTGGPGHPVILLHAGTQSAAGWVYQQPALARAGYRAIGYSRRGYYRSDSTTDPGWTVADDLHHLVAHLGLRSVDLVGAAQGGFVVLDYLFAYPGMVRGVAIVSSYMGIQEPDYAAVNTRLRPPFFATLPHDFQELSPSYRAGNPDGVAAWHHEEERAVTGKRIAPVLRTTPTWALLEGIRHPVLLATGDSDLYVPPSLLRMQASHIPGAEVHVVPEAGHSPYWEQPALFNRILLDFLAKLGS